MAEKQKGSTHKRFSVLPFVGSVVPSIVVGWVSLLGEAAWAAPLQNWRFDPATHQLEVTVKSGVKPRYSFAAQPARIILELPATELGNVKLEETYSGAVRQIRVSQGQSGITRFTLLLAPNTVLQREQVKFMRLADKDAQTDRWMLRPLIASVPGDAAIAQNPTAPNATLPRFATLKTVSIAAAPVALPAPNPTAIAYPPGLAPGDQLHLNPPSSTSLQKINPTAAEVQPGTPTVAQLPTPQPEVPLTPNGVVPVPMPAEAYPPGLAPIAEKPSEKLPEIVAQATALTPEKGELERSTRSPIAEPIAEPQVVAQTLNPLQLSEVNSSLAIPDALPPLTMPTSSTPTVAVPPLQRATPTAPPAPPLPSNPQSYPATGAPGLPMQTVEPPRSPQYPAQYPAQTIEFGQPLPMNGTNGAVPAQGYGVPQPSSPVLTSMVPGVVLPAGTLLNLRYGGDEPLKLNPKQPIQEVLILQNEVRDRNGNLLIPMNSPVFGQFEGNRFIAQQIEIQGRNYPFVGQSESLGGGRQLNERHLLRNSGIGALAGAVIGGLSGGTVIGGAAVGAGVTYAIAPKSSTIQPGQVVQIRLTDDLR